MNKNQELPNTWKITGAGGKGGPSEDPNTLRSKASAKILAVISEGEIEGFPEGASQEEILQRIFLDDTPILSQTGFNMFDEGVEVAFRFGTQGQQSLPGHDDIRVEQSIGLQVKGDVGPVSSTTTNSLLNRIVVRVGVASLFRVSDAGDIRGTFVDFSIEIRDLFGVLVNEGRTNFTIRGKTRSPFDRDYPFSLSGTGPWTVSVVRQTPDSESARLNNDLFFRAIVGIIDETLRYPNSALVSVQVSAENFQNVPSIGILARGVKIKVPSNYNASSNRYRGVWDGTFKTEYNNNPVWVFLDLITNARYGAGGFVDIDDVDIFALLPIAKYCDEMVPNGKGGMEKRFTFNAYINNRGEAFEVLNALAAVFRGMLYYAQGQVTATQDTKKSVTHQFSPSNVITQVSEQGELTSPPFVYEGTGRKARKTVALVSWNDPDDNYRGKIEYVEDRIGIKRYGYQEVDVRAFGCTSQGQAQRIGKWTLLSNLLETETVTFKVGAEGFFMMPGEVIEIADPDKNTGILAGIAPAIEESSILLDRDVVLAPNISYQIIVNDGQGNSIVRSITTAAGQHSSLSVSPAFPPLQAPVPWIIRESVAEPQKYRAMALSEDQGIVTILATAYSEEKFDVIDASAQIDAQRTSVPALNIVPVVSAGSIQLQVR
jgi:predicted phage tail protein